MRNNSSIIRDIVTGMESKDLALREGLQQALSTKDCNKHSQQNPNTVYLIGLGSKGDSDRQWRDVTHEKAVEIADEVIIKVSCG